MELGQGKPALPYFKMALGMAEYRSGLYGEADETLSSAIQTAPTAGARPDTITGTAGYFRAMLLFKQGKLAEARAVFTSTEAGMRPMPTELKPPFAEFHDDIMVWLACKEAKALLQIPDAGSAVGVWEDLLAALTPALVEQTGNGWRLEKGALYSPDKPFAALLLPGNFTATSYQVRVKLRQRTAKESFNFILPVGNRMVCFGLDGWPKLGYYTTLYVVDGTAGNDLPGAIKGKQVKDSGPHDLEVTVRLDGASATISSTLDARPLYERTGPIAALKVFPDFATIPPGSLALGTNADDWVVSEVTVKRLAGGVPTPAQTRPIETAEPPLVGARKIKIKANDPMGGRVGAVHAGQTITVQYVEGRWSENAQDNGDPKGWASPDDNGTGSHSCTGLYAVAGGETTLLTEIPAGTKDRPFHYRFDKTYGRVLLRIRDPSVEDNLGEVTYAVSLSP